MLFCAAAALTSEVALWFTLEHGSHFARSGHQKTRGGHILTLALLWPTAPKEPTQLCHKALTNTSRASTTHSFNEVELVNYFNFIALPWLTVWFYLSCAQKHSRDGRKNLQGTKPGKHVIDFEVAFPNWNGSIHHLKCYHCWRGFIFQMASMCFYYFSLFLSKDQES